MTIFLLYELVDRFDIINVVDTFEGAKELAQKRNHELADPDQDESITWEREADNVWEGDSAIGSYRIEQMEVIQVKR